MKKLIKWSPAEIEIVKEEVNKLPNNLKNAFENAALRLTNRKVDAITKKWYNIRNKENAVIVTASKTSPILKNVKNTPRTAVYNTQGEVIDFKSVMRDIIKLPAKELNVLRQYIDCIS